MRRTLLARVFPVCGRGVAVAVVAALCAAPVSAGEADVIEAHAHCDSDEKCTFRVMVHHADQGWKHYADRWEIVGPDGAVLATRVLRHPHVGEQPFTRELAGVEVPNEIGEVTLRARDSQHGYGGAEVRVKLSRTAPAAH